MNQDLKNKLASRKLFAFIVWCIIALTTIIGAMFGSYDLPTETVIKSFSAVTLIYIGGQSVVDSFKK